MLGRWSSSAYLLYIKTARDKLAMYSAVLGNLPQCMAIIVRAFIVSVLKVMFRATSAPVLCLCVWYDYYQFFTQCYYMYSTYGPSVWARFGPTIITN